MSLVDLSSFTEPLNFSLLEDQPNDVRFLDAGSPGCYTWFGASFLPLELALANLVSGQKPTAVDLNF